jgi:hypothetical protein
MYPKGCFPGDASMRLVIYLDGNQLGDPKTIETETYFDHVYNATWPKGKYDVRIDANYTATTPNFVKDYTFRVYFKDPVEIFYSTI